MRNKSSILMIYTGGTIGMKQDPARQALVPFDFSQILEEVPEMRIEEAIVYLLATEGCGTTTDTLAEQINLRRLHLRRDGQPVTSSQVYAVARRFPEMFVKDGRLIRLMA